MQKTVIISANDNDNYLFFVPVVNWAWKKFGWDVHCVFTGDQTGEKWGLVKKYSPGLTYSFPAKIEGVRNETLTQLSRLYAYTFCKEGYVMTSDVDMLPLSDYWKFDENEITSWGRDLSDKHYPICYIGASKENWGILMEGNFILKDLANHPKHKSEIWEEWWQVDQDIITEKLNKQKITRIDRGIQGSSGYPLGRVDRSCWQTSQYTPYKIDAHLLRPGNNFENWSSIIDLLRLCLKPGLIELFELNSFKEKYNLL